MIDIIYKIVALSLLVCPLIFIMTNIYLTIKLRSKKYELINNIANHAPEKFREKAFLVMDNLMPWVAGSAIGYVWFSYPILRFVWGIQKSEISQWKIGIKKEMGSIYFIYWISIMCANVGIFSILVVIVDEFLIS